MTLGSRRPAWRDEGTEPDPRVSLANERTYLAWVRTALAMLAASVGVIHFVPGDRFPVLRTLLSLVLAALGVTLAAGMYARWRSIERATRRGEPLPHSLLLPLMAVLLSAAGVLVLVLVGVR